MLAVAKLSKPPSPSEGEGNKKSRGFPFSSCLKFFIRHPEVFALKLFRFLTNTFRSDAPSLVIPEIFNRESTEEDVFLILSGLLFFYIFCFFGGYEGAAPPYSTFPSFPKFLVGNPCFFFCFKYCGPRLEDCRGDEKGAIEPFRGRLKTA